MANYETIDFSREQQKTVIDTFREYYRATGDAVEMTSESLVSHHDPSIRFTNSTTSVMKPFLNSERPLDAITYLAQPAMGQQGLYYWQRDRIFGPYASYFMSLGALYPPQEKERSLTDIQAIAERWGIESDQLTFAVHESDEDLIQLLSENDVPIEVGSDEAHFRHVYGLEGISGRNANLRMRDINDTQRTLGNLTLIQTNEGQPIAYEVSFDSTTATSLARKLAHPVFAHYQIVPFDSPGSRALTDTLSASSALIAEGLAPVSKGRAGTTRKFLLEYLQLAKSIQGLSDNDISNTLKSAADEEIAFRQHASPERHPSTSYKKAVAIIDHWVGGLALRAVNH